MLPEVGGLEWLIIAIVALVVVGPKDLPVLMRRVGQFMNKLRAMAADFRSSFDEMARQSELDDLRKEVEAMRRGQYADIAAHSGVPEMEAAIAEIDQNLADVGVQLHPPMSYQYAEQTPPPPPEQAVTIAAAPPKPARKPRAKKAAAASAGAPKPAKVVEGGPRRRKPTVEGGA
jgi:sec-independent protein translocase protein TatB